MKLKSLLLLTLMVCAFFSCSGNDEPVIKTITPVIPDATLSIVAQSDSKVKTKGGFIENDTKKWDEEVKTLTVLLFNNNNPAYIAASVPTDGLIAVYSQAVDASSAASQISGMEVKAGNAQLFVIANLETRIIDNLKSVASSANPTDRLSFQEIVEKYPTMLDTEGKDKGLTMSSPLIGVEIVQGPNYVGFADKDASFTGVIGTGKEIFGKEPVVLTRTVAAINLVKIEMPQYPDNSTDQTPYYESIKLDLKEVFIANVKSQAMIGNTDGTSTVEVSSVSTSGTWDAGFYYAPESYKAMEGTLKKGTSTGKENLLTSLSGQSLSTENGDVTWVPKAGTIQIPPCYVYPNGEGETSDATVKNYTVLVVKGDYTYRNSEGGSVIKETDRYFAIVVNDKNFGSSAGGTGAWGSHIQRNTKYNVTLQVWGSGSDKPFTPAAFAHVSAKVEVAKWNVVNIDDEID